MAVSHKVGGAMASWLVRSTPDRAVWVRDLAGDIVLCSWAFNAGGNPAMN